MATAEPCVTPDFALGYRELMLQGLADEVQTTKKVLAAIPENKKEFRPDPNARTAWELAWHLANSDVQFLNGIADGKFNFEAADDEHSPHTVAQLVAWYDENMTRAAERVRQLNPEQLVRQLDFYGAFNLPAAFYLGFLNNHSIHHRGQLATYLRPMGAKCPSIYGGSYDHPWQGAETSSAA